jgi:hypothetical protein
MLTLFFDLFFQKTTTRERERDTQKTAPHRKRSRCLRRRRCHPISSSRFLSVVSVAPTFVSPDRSWTRFVWTDARTSFFKLFLPGVAEREFLKTKTERSFFLGEDSRHRRRTRCESERVCVCVCVRVYARVCKEKTRTTLSLFCVRACFSIFESRARFVVSLTSLPSRKKNLKRFKILKSRDLSKTNNNKTKNYYTIVLLPSTRN